MTELFRLATEDYATLRAKGRGTVVMEDHDSSMIQKTSLAD